MSINERGDKPKRKRGSDITVKQEAFALAYVETGNASEAYRRAYDVKPDAKPEGIWVDACKTLGKPNVALRVMQLKEQHAKRHDITVDSLTDMLVSDRELARKVEEPKAAIDAVMAIAKLHGKIIDKVEAKSQVQASVSVASVDRPERETREAWIARRQRELAAAASTVGAAARTTN